MAAPATPVIRLEAARKEYPDGTVAVEGLDLDVREHELMVLVGPSGCGKSTTLRMVNRLVEPTSGRVLVQGEDVMGVDAVALRRRIGYVIQHVGLFPHRTVVQNVATVPALLGWDAARTRERTAELLDLVGLDHAVYGPRYPHQLSGGEQQRVGVARALAADPPVLLMDEPFGAVDPAGRRRLQAEFWKIQRTLGTTVMLVTHDIDEAVRLGDRIAVFSRGGHLEQLADAVTLLARPETDLVRDFVGTGRAVRLLGIGEVAATDLEPLPSVVAGDAEHVAADLAPSDAVRVHGRLDDAFAALAASGGRPVTVLGEDGRPAGLLSMTGLLGALRRITADAAEAA
jgi:osmoprotectant transport system ATP-binding protein